MTRHCLTAFLTALYCLKNTAETFIISAVLLNQPSYNDVTDRLKSSLPVIQQALNTLEDELMVIARDAARIYSFGNRCLFNFKDATLLVRQMPADGDKAGRYRDHLSGELTDISSDGM